MNHRGRWVLACLAVLLLSCDEGPTNPSGPWTGQVDVAGVIRDFRTNAAVPGARVTIGARTVTTNTDGSYTIRLPAGDYDVTIDGETINGVARLNISSYRGDFYVHSDGCAGRYGTVADPRQHRPVSSATVVTGATTATDRDGWYNVGLGCDSRCFGFNTSFLTATHPDYLDASVLNGRGVCDVVRVDVELTHR